MLAKEYLEQARAFLERIEETQLGRIQEAAEVISQAIIEGHALYAFGCTHSSLPVEDIFYRAGGLMLVNPIFGPGLSLDIRPPTFTSGMERIEGYGQMLLERVPIQEGDVLILVSVSGRNPVPVDMARAARDRGVIVIGVTSMEYTVQLPSRHSSGRKMYEFADLVLDNQAPPGDAILELEGVPQKLCPISGITSIAILHALVAETVERLAARGFTPPVYLAANVQGGDEWNARLLKEYEDRIFYM